MKSLIQTLLARAGSRTSTPFAVRFAGGGEYRSRDGEPAFTMVFNRPRAYWRIAAYGHIGMLES